MKKNIFILLLLSFFLPESGNTQVVFFINAGSRSNYGQIQELFIHENGAGQYRLSGVNTGIKETISFALTAAQKDSLLQEAESGGFFSLDKKYDGGAMDGAGIYIAISHSGRKHAVELLNTDQPSINRIVTLLNNMLAPRLIRINYGQFIIPRNR